MEGRALQIDLRLALVQLVEPLARNSARPIGIASLELLGLPGLMLNSRLPRQTSAGWLCAERVDESYRSGKIFSVALNS
jgi:hypothetical protein